MEVEERDVNEAFDSIVRIEERLSAEGYSEGFEAGLKEGAGEGFHLGYHRGAELGAELGYYAGTAKTWLALDTNSASSKAKQSLEKVLQLIENFPRTNVDHIDFSAAVDCIRVSFKRACSILKISASYPEASKLSF